MKKKFFRLLAAGLLFFSGIMEIGWRFFNMVVRCKRGGGKRKEKNGLNYPIYEIIIPETDTQRNMRRAGHGVKLRRCRTAISGVWMD